MFEFIKRLFGKKKKKEETAVKETKVQLSALEPDEELKDTEMPSSRYTEEYAAFAEAQISNAEPTRTLEEEMLDDPFADVAAQDEDFGVPELPEAEAEEPVQEKSLEEQMLEEPFADIEAEYEENE